MQSWGTPGLSPYSPYKDIHVVTWGLSQLNIFFKRSFIVEKLSCDDRPDVLSNRKTAPTVCTLPQDKSIRWLYPKPRTHWLFLFPLVAKFFQLYWNTLNKYKLNIFNMYMMFWNMYLLWNDHHNKVINISNTLHSYLLCGDQGRWKDLHFYKFHIYNTVLLL